jgi:NADH dehydrogenase/NADH:ubiquinone oxidoreductase subunit G
MSSVDVPHYCWHEVDGSCRLCQVEWRASRSQSPFTPVQEGMVVHTNTPRVRRRARAR